MKLVSLGRLDQAETMLRELERAAPGEFEIQYRLGLVLLRQGKLEDARPRLELARKLQPDVPVARAALALLHSSLGRTAAANGDAPAAAREFQQAIQIDPSRPVYCLELAQLLLDHETPEPAELILRNAAARFPVNGEVLRMLALAIFAQGRSREALEAFLKVIDLAPELESSYASLEVLLPDAGPRLPEVAARLRKFVRNHPESPLGPYLLALITPEKAEPLLRQAIAADANFWPAYFELHKLLQANGKDDEAGAALVKVVELNPEFAPAHYALAEYYMKKGDRASSVRERELHHRLMTMRRDAEAEHRVRAPRLAFTVESR
jgi:tetratricopeptide (TPR) repeat protein